MNVKYYIAALCLFFISNNNLLFSQSLLFQRNYGGSSGDVGNSMIVKPNSNLVIAGETSSEDFDLSTIVVRSTDAWLMEIDSAGNILFQKCFGGTQNEIASSIISTKDGGYVFAGSATSNDGDVWGVHGSFFVKDFWIVKLDSNYNIQWQKCVGSYSNDEAKKIVQTRDSGYLVVGNAGDNGGDVSGYHGNYDCFVVKLSKSGSLQWTKAIGGSSYESGQSGLQTIDGGYVIMGFGGSNDGDFPPTHVGGIFVTKLDSLGNIQWLHTYGGTSGEDAYAMIGEADGTFVVAGSTSSNDGDVTGNNGPPDLWIFKCDTAGTLIWQKCLGGLSWESGFTISKAIDGGYVIGSTSLSDDGIVFGNHGGFDVWFLKTDSIGAFEWGKSFGGTQMDEVRSVLETAENKFYFTGYSRSNDGDLNSNYGYQDLWFAQVSPFDVGVPTVENSNDFNLSISTSENHNFELTFFLKSAESVEICILDILGRVLYKKRISAFSGINQVELNISSNNGIAILKMSSRSKMQIVKLYQGN